MKQSEAKDFLPIIEAWAEGKQLQLKSEDSGRWIDVSKHYNVGFTGGVENYRIKPEPRTFYAVEYDDGSIGFVCSAKKQRDGFNREGGGRPITLMEVLDD